MYRIALFFAFLAYCLAVPLTDSNAQKQGLLEQNKSAQEPVRQVSQQQKQSQQEDDGSDVVDNTGAGYSFFKMQNVGSRPLILQQPDLSSQSESLSSQDQFQWSNYLRASALKQQPVRQQQSHSISTDQLNSAQQPSIPSSQMNKDAPISMQERLTQQRNAYAAQEQQQQEQQPKTLNKDPGYSSGQIFSSLAKGYDNRQLLQDKPWWSIKQMQKQLDSSYNQIPQQQDLQQPFLSQQKLIAKQQTPDNDLFDFSSQQPLIQPTSFSIKSQSNYAQQPQPQPQPTLDDQLIENYAQQKQQLPLVRSSIQWNTQQQNLRPTLADQQTAYSNNYGNFQQDLLVQQQPKLWGIQQKTMVIPSMRQVQEQPIITTGYPSNTQVQRIMTQPTQQQQIQQNSFSDSLKTSGW